MYNRRRGPAAGSSKIFRWLCTGRRTTRTPLLIVPAPSGRTLRKDRYVARGVVLLLSPTPRQVRFLITNPILRLICSVGPCSILYRGEKEKNHGGRATCGRNIFPFASAFARRTSDRDAGLCGGRVHQNQRQREKVYPLLRVILWSSKNYRSVLAPPERGKLPRRATTEISKKDQCGRTTDHR